MKLWQTLSHLGVTDELSPPQAKRVILFNQLILISMVSVGIAIALFYVEFLPFRTLYPVQLGFLAVATTALLLIRARRYAAAKLLCMMYSPFWFFEMCIAAGPQAGFHFYWVLLIMLPFLVLTPDEKRVFIAAQTLNVLSLAAIVYWFLHYPPLEGVPPEARDRVYFQSLVNAGAMIVLFIYYMSRTSYRAEMKLEHERARSDGLLLNILPAPVAEELKENGTARPVRFEHVSVLFTDFEGFTRIAESVEPETLVHELDECFSRFDEISRRHRLEKIKTIGDAYMAAGGIPTPGPAHAVDCVLAALAMVEFMEAARRKATPGGSSFTLRIGIHTGPLVAGVVGRSKFAYDVFGDTVNVASRMESSGQAGRVNISDATFATVGEFFDCEARGKLPVKNRGEIEMYFVNGIKTALGQTNGNGTRNESVGPGPAFAELYRKRFGIELESSEDIPLSGRN